MARAYVTDDVPLGRLAEVQAALRRVATLVARAASAAEVFEAVLGEVGRLIPADAAALCRFEADGSLTTIGLWSATGGYVPSGTRHVPEEGSLAKLVSETQRPGRIAGYEDASGSLAEAARRCGWRSSVGAPILVEGGVWGLIAVASTTDRPLPAGTEGRLAEFTELVAAAIASAHTREDLARLAEEQAAFRRVATLVARGPPPRHLFAVVAEQVGQVLHVPVVSVLRYEPDGTASERASFSTRGELFPVGTVWPLDGPSVVAEVFETGRPARIDDHTGLEGTIAEHCRRAGIGSSVGIPIVVAGRTWGVMVVSSSRPELLPENTEARLADFTELVATAISNSEAQEEARRLSDEQAALRRVATLVAQGVPPSELFGAAAAEVGKLLGADLAGMICYQDDDTLVAVATWAARGEHPPVDGRWPLEGDRMATRIAATAQPVREDDWGEVGGPIAAFVRNELGIASTVGSPIVVEGRVWGALFVHSKDEARPLPPDTESRMLNFTDLVATAMSNAQARAEVQRLADEQAALRRVATRVAEGRPAAEVFAAVAEEVGKLLGCDLTTMVRYESDGTGTVMAEWSEHRAPHPIGTTVPLEGNNVTGLVFTTGRPARVDDPANRTGLVGEMASAAGLRSSAGSPIVVNGRLWGVMIASSLQPGPLPPETESHIGEFTELAATAIANLEARSDLAASRARIVAATDQARRRVERDLHDGVQQRLVSIALELRGAEAAMPAEYAGLRAQLSRIADGLAGVLDELREVSRGIHPAVLSEGGLAPALRALARRSAIPVKLELDVGEPLEEQVEVAAYYVVSEALANAAKHARASAAEVQVGTRDGILDIAVRDDGVGGADPARGSGLIGLSDRVEALGGTIAIASPAGEGTSLHVRLPVDVAAASGSPR